MGFWKDGWAVRKTDGAIRKMNGAIGKMNGLLDRWVLQPIFVMSCVIGL
jgi:hypothetical protein